MNIDAIYHILLRGSQHPPIAPPHKYTYRQYAKRSKKPCSQSEHAGHLVSTNEFVQRIIVLEARGRELSWLVRGRSLKQNDRLFELMAEDWLENQLGS